MALKRLFLPCTQPSMDFWRCWWYHNYSQNFYWYLPPYRWSSCIFFHFNGSCSFWLLISGCLVPRGRGLHRCWCRVETKLLHCQARRWFVDPIYIDLLILMLLPLTSNMLISLEDASSCWWWLLVSPRVRWIISSAWLWFHKRWHHCLWGWLLGTF